MPATEQIRKVEAVADAGPGADEETHTANFGDADTIGSETKSIDSKEASDRSHNGDVEPERASDPTPNSEKGAGDVAGRPEPEQEERSRAKILVIMISLCLAVFLAAIDVTIVTTALPTISDYFHSAAGYTWIGSAYILGNAAATPVWGKFSDIFGRKPVLLTANGVFFIGSLISAVSTSIGMLITGRAIQGIGGGGLIVLVNICIGDLFSVRRRGAYYGIIGGIWAIAGSIGPLLGGVFTEKVSWRWCFYINLPIDGIAFIIIFLFLDLKTPKTPFLSGLKAIDWLGALLIMGGTLMFLFGLDFGGQTYPWDSATVICLLVFGVVAACLFVLVEWKFAKYPIMPIRIFKYRSNIAALAVCFVHGFVFVSGSYYLPLYFQATRGATPILSGVYLLPQTGATSVGSIGTGIFIRKTGKYLPPIFFGLFFMTIGFGLFIDFARDSSWAKIIVYQLIAGLGVGPLFQAPLIALQSLVAPRDIATGIATFGFTRNLASAISIVAGQVVFQNLMSSKSGQLTREIGPVAAQRLGGGNAGANVDYLNSLPPAKRLDAQNIIANSLHYIWIMYACVAGLGMIAACLITKQTLQKTHQETKTGLEEEEKNRLEAKENRDLRKVDAARARGEEV